MTMNFVVKLFPEITIKSPKVRQRWTRQLADNLRKLLKPLCTELDVQGFEVVHRWDRIDIEVPSDDESLAKQLVEAMLCVPGIAYFQRVEEFPLSTLEDAGELAAEMYAEEVKGKTFRMTVKRTGTHDFRSVDAERIIGGIVKARTENAGVKLNRPEVHLQAVIRDQCLFLVAQRWQGLGGFPLGTQEAVLSLISGGFDSTAASYQMIRRGMTTHFCFFNLGGHQHEIGVKEIAYFLWNKFGSSKKVKFVTVPFEGVVEEILDKVDNSQMGVILKRMMLRVATQVAERVGAGALVTGEAIAQVSSQTLTNLRIIDSVTEALVLRPLIVSDKETIIAQTRAIGAEEFAASIPEYCAVISKKPTTKACPDRIAKEEGNFDFSVLDKAVENTRIVAIHQVIKDLNKEIELEFSDQVQEKQQVIDIRHPDEQELKPLLLEGKEVLHIPFYKLDGAFVELDKTLQYLLYCEKGVVSQLHAAHLKEAGHENVGVYQVKNLKN